MEGNENENWNGNPCEYLKPIEIGTMASWKTISNLSFLSSNDPLFSCIITLYILILLYFPQTFSLKILFSPVLILTASLLLSLLRLGAIQRIQTETKEKSSLPEAEAEAEAEAEKTEFSQQELIWETCKKDPELTVQSFEETFVEWNVRAPLEVIYEEYDGQEEDPNKNDSNPTPVLERHPSLSLYYPESDSDSSSSETDFPAIGEWVSSEKICYRWEEEDREGLIEIALDKRDLDFHGEEENLIEIDISSVKG